MNALVALLQSRKFLIATGGIVGCVLILLFFKGASAEKIAAMTAFAGIAWKWIDAIAVEDAATKAARSVLTLPPTIPSDTPTDPETPAAKKGLEQ